MVGTSSTVRFPMLNSTSIPSLGQQHVHNAYSSSSNDFPSKQQMQTRHHYKVTQDFVERKLWTEDADVQSFYETYYDTASDFRLMNDRSFFYDRRDQSNPQNREWKFKTKCQITEDGVSFLPIDETKESLERKLAAPLVPFLSLSVDRYFLKETKGWFDVVSVVGKSKYYVVRTTETPDTGIPAPSKILAFTSSDERFSSIIPVEEKQRAEGVELFVTELTEQEKDIYL